MSIASLLCLALAAATPEAGKADARPAIAAVLDDWHKAAAEADEARYFGHFTADGVFLGTDATERWTRDAFRVWAKPFFARGKAWSFKAVSRNISLSKDGAVAWFDEALDTPNMGPCRGSGVLVKEGTGWKIAQYNLSVPIPNALLPDFKGRIEAHLKQPQAPRAAGTTRSTASPTSTRSPESNTPPEPVRPGAGP
ncbi:nuclear transport factor 2 family protein [Hyalangium rubrum]|uniref:Nuclear transport factor 2 family protein n=1 Tax=Hyalangium rubrum TaxID=3103134 RepID=A0ABU5HGF2_9BACT|nr:nuclear transport factor 2 family protein [Hyalangium sp. s54d21]MDY7232224.1 nuclear transport factor 2 family protein [Hyalangium sp. s54d21]